MWFLNTKLMKIMEFDLKWIHMAPYELILRQEEAILLRIISEPLPTPKRVMKGQKIQKNLKSSEEGGNPFTGTNETWPCIQELNISARTSMAVDVRIALHEAMVEATQLPHDSIRLLSIRKGSVLADFEVRGAMDVVEKSPPHTLKLP